MFSDRVATRVLIIITALAVFVLVANSCNDETLERGGKQITVSELRADSLADIEENGWDVACAEFVAMSSPAVSMVITTGVEFGYFPDVETGTRIMAIHKEVCNDVQ